MTQPPSPPTPGMRLVREATDAAESKREKDKEAGARMLGRERRGGG